LIFPWPSILACLDCPMVYRLWWLQFIFPSSLAHHSMPEQSVKSLIYGFRFSVNRPMDLNALLFYAWMMSEGCSCQWSTSIVFPWLIVVLCLLAKVLLQFCFTSVLSKGILFFNDFHDSFLLSKGKILACPLDDSVSFKPCDCDEILSLWVTLCWLRYFFITSDCDWTFRQRFTHFRLWVIHLLNDEFTPFFIVFLS